MNKMNPKVDEYVANAKQWQEEIKKLRKILLDSELTEDVKWGAPCYTFQNQNVILLYVLKAYMGIGFIKGALLSDTQGILIKQSENTRAVRLIKFINVQEINKLESVLKTYINEAVEIERAGLKVDLKSNSELIYPDEFQKKLDENPELKIAFDALTPGRKRAYNLYFSAPKQSITRESRIEKLLQKILNGKGIDD